MAKEVRLCPCRYIPREASRRASSIAGRSMQATPRLVRKRLACAIHPAAIGLNELVMIGSGIQAWVFCLIGVRFASAYQEIAPVLEIIHVFSNSYRVASPGVGSIALYGRFAIGFCRAFLISLIGRFASRWLHHASATVGTHFRHRGQAIDTSTRSTDSSRPAASDRKPSPPANFNVAAAAQWRGVND
jgi:hypothetical protein